MRLPPRPLQRLAAVNRVFDVVVVGSGLAGLTVALSLADARRVAVVCKRSVAEGATDQAQGGIAAALASDDDYDRHVHDTLVAGSGLCDEAATRFIVGQGRTSIAWLAAQGVHFTRDQVDSYHLAQEGGHTRRRIVHAADATGHEVHRALAQRLRTHPNITILEDQTAVDLITSINAGRGNPRCDGAYVLDAGSGCVGTIRATHTVLATGGAGRLYLHTSNPATATGDGIAMAWRAGCSVANLEFVQFHPTCLHHPGGGSFLISEAMRGEGAMLRLPPAAGEASGLRFMPLHDARAELAPRDVVARAIEQEMKTRALNYVHLDITGRPAEFVRNHFPTIHARCLALGIDPTREPIPVTPAAHYTCGGVVTSPTARTDLEDLYAVGEVACTGLHGANRLASNSLLECVAMGRAAARDILHRRSSAPAPLPSSREWSSTAMATAETAARYWKELRNAMWTNVGIVRTTQGLLQARRRIVRLREESGAARTRAGYDPELLELRNALEVAGLIVECALSRLESRGAHFNCDYPAALSKALPTVLTPQPPARERFHARQRPVTALSAGSSW
jgi:L-aspartate oxidase